LIKFPVLLAMIFAAAFQSTLASAGQSTNSVSEQSDGSNAQDNNGGNGRHGLSPEQFQNMKVKFIEKHQKHVAILQQGESCIQEATEPEQLKICLQQERLSEMQLREQTIQSREKRNRVGSGSQDSHQ